MTRRRKLLFSLVALAIALLLVELGTKAWLHWVADEDAFRRYASISQLRARYGVFDRYRSHRHLGFALAPGFVQGDTRHNSLGFRGEELAIDKPEGTTRIVCCGGSTTYGFGVHNDDLTMPKLLQFVLREQGRQVEVVNAGCPGWTTFETLINFESRVLDLAPDFVVVYHGINDVLARMVWPPEAMRGDQSGWLVRENHLAEASWAERSDLLRILLIRGGMIEPHGSMLRVIGDRADSNRTFEFRRQRLGGTYPEGVFAEVPIERMLQQNGTRLFRRNLESLIAVAERHGVQVLLMPFAYSKEFPDKPNIGHPAVQAAIDAGNDVVRELARVHGVGLLDLTGELTEKAMYTDGEHFTVYGNGKRVERMAPWFLERL